MTDLGNDIGSKAWRARNFKITPACLVLWWGWFGAMTVLKDHWKWGAVLVIPIGIWMSRPGLRRWLGAALLILFLIWGRGYGSVLNGSGLLPDLLLYFWLGGFFWNWYADGQVAKQLTRRKGREWK